MAALDDLVVTEKRNQPAIQSTRANVVYSRTVTFILTALATAATVDLTGLKLPPGTLVLGGSINPAATLGAAATFALKTETAGVTFVAAAIVTGERGLDIVVGSTLAVPDSAVADDQVQLVMAVAAAPADDVEVKLTLLLAGVDTIDQYATYDT